MLRAIDQNSRNPEPSLCVSGGVWEEATVKVVESEAGQVVASVQEAACEALRAFERALCINRAIQREVEVA